MIKKLFSLSENLFIKAAFLTFAFRSKCRVNKSTSCKKKDREKTNTPLRVVKNQEHRNIGTLSLQLRSYNSNNQNLKFLPFIALELNIGPSFHNLLDSINSFAQQIVTSRHSCTL